MPSRSRFIGIDVVVPLMVDHGKQDHLFQLGDLFGRFILFQLMLTMEFLRQDGLKGLLVLRLIELLINLTEQPGLACFLQHRFPLRRIGAFGVATGSAARLAAA